jgi:hypothetical protein
MVPRRELKTDLLTIQATLKNLLGLTDRELDSMYIETLEELMRQARQAALKYLETH